MELLELVLSLTLLAVGIWLIVYFLRALLGPLSSTLSDAFVKRKFDSRVQALGEALDNIDQGRISPARPLLKKAFFTRELASNIRTVEQLHTHNLRCLEGIIRLQQLPASARRALTQLEEAVVERGKLLRTYVERAEALRVVKDGEKETPDWAQAEFEKKAKETRSDLSENSKRFEDLIEQLFRGLEGDDDGSEITYH